MKKLATVLSLVLMLAVISVSAFNYVPTVIRAEIPFDFIVKDKTVPAGTYTVSQSSQRRPDVLVIQDLDGRSHGVVDTQVTLPKGGWYVFSASGEYDAKLVFNRYGNQYFLSQIWTAGKADGYEVYKSHKERELARNLSEPDEGIHLAAMTVPTLP